VQLKVLETFMPIVRKVDRAWPWRGISAIAIATKK